jgi:quercetin dioxygenase-like cupin family protein
MKKFNINNTVRGWFVGEFEPTFYKTNDCEVGLKKYKKGALEDKHFHKLSTEITGIISGSARMNNLVLNEGDFILIEPNEAFDFEALEDTVTIVFKSKSVKNDKYLV